MKSHLQAHIFILIWNDKNKNYKSDKRLKNSTGGTFLLLSGKEYNIHLCYNGTNKLEGKIKNTRNIYKEMMTSIHIFKIDLPREKLFDYCFIV